MTVPSIPVLLDHVLGVFLGNPKFERFVCVEKVVANEVGVEDVQFVLLVEGIVETEDLGADYFVISIDNIGNLVVVAVLVHSIVDVLCCSLVDCVPKQDELVLGDVSPLEILRDVVGSVVGREVVDDDHPVVAVLLEQDGLDVPGVPELADVLVGGSHNAGMQFLLVLVYLVSLLVVLLLLLVEPAEFGDVPVVLPSQ